MKYIKYMYLTIIIIAFCVSAIIVYIGFNPVHYAEISLFPAVQSQSQLFTKNILTRVDDNGVAFFDFRAAIYSPSSKEIFLEIRPHANSTYFRQGNGYKIIKGFVSGVGRLGSKKYPLHQNEKYSFQLVDNSGYTYMIGNISATVYPVAGVSQCIIIFIGILASILQIAGAVLHYIYLSRTKNIKTNESNAVDSA